MRGALLALAFAFVSTPVAAAPLFEGDVAALATDGEKLFVGAFDRGVFEIGRDGRAKPFTVAGLNPNVNALLVDAARERLYVATARGVVRCTLKAPRECRRVGERSSVHALVQLGNGVVLAGGDDGVLAIDAEGRSAHYSRKLGAPYRAVWALAETSDGTVFVGATNGLHFASRDVFDPGSGAPKKPAMKRAGMITGTLPDDWVTALSVDHGLLRVGTYNSGVTSFRFEAGALAPASNDAALGYVNPAGITPLEGGRFAVATMDGLRVGGAGKWTRVATDANDVTAVLRVPGSDDYWVATRRGVTRMVLASVAGAR
jgi:ligand-binding sensor domain-containing protein